MYVSIRIKDITQINIGLLNPRITSFSNVIIIEEGDTRIVMSITEREKHHMSLALSNTLPMKKNGEKN